MNPNQSPSDPSQDREILITRTFQAPRELVWQAWTDPERLKQWHAPHGCEIEFKRFDFRVGGGFHSGIRNPAFGECWCVAEYLEIVRLERIVYRMGMADAEGHRADPAAVGHDPEWPAETIVTLTFEDRGHETLLTLTQNVSEALARRTGAYPSWLAMLDRLADQLTA